MGVDQYHGAKIVNYTPHPLASPREPVPSGRRGKRGKRGTGGQGVRCFANNSYF